MSDKKIKLTLENHPETIDLPLYQATIGYDVFDVTSLTSHHLFTYDPGFMSTASCQSKITYIDGEKGILLHRGYPIEQLARQSDYLELCYLLLHGELPNVEQKKDFIKATQQFNELPKQISTIFDTFQREAHPMAMLISAMGALAAHYHETLDLQNPNYRLKIAYTLLGLMPLLITLCYKHSRGESLNNIVADPSKTYAENFLQMTFGTSDPTLARAMDRILILHADHEQNASTSSVRMVGSTGTDPFACIAAGIAALWGPAHGGANEAALTMLKEIGELSRIPLYIARAKDKNDPFRLMGFGHRVYKSYDPRAAVMRESCLEVLEALGLHETNLLKIAMQLEKIALEDDYFIQRKLYPNVDFYSGITLNALGIPSNLFTGIFAMSRTIGWIAQWHEMFHESKLTLSRPRQLYIGDQQRDFIPLNTRK